jgi:flagellar FliL protein
LRGLKISDLQKRLETVLFADFASKNAAVPFKHVLVNKLIVQ